MILTHVYYEHALVAERLIDWLVCNGTLAQIGQLLPVGQGGVPALAVEDCQRKRKYAI